MSEEIFKLTLLLLFALCAGVLLMFSGFRWHRQLRMIRDTPTSKARSIAMGPVEITGKIGRYQRILTSPFSAKPCVYYRYVIQEYRQGNKRGRWVTIKNAVDSTRFYVSDDTGKVLVNPKGAEIDIPADNVFNSAIGSDPPPTVMKFLTENNLKFESFLGINKRMRYTEYYIGPGETIYVLGTAASNPDVEEGTAQNSVDRVMIQKGPKANFFYISDTSEKTLLTKFKWKVIGGLWGGSVIIIGSITGLAFIFGGIL